MTLKTGRIRIPIPRLTSNPASQMKEKIQKLASALTIAVTMLKEEKVAEATEALEAVATEVSALQESAEAVEKSVSEKDAAIAKMTEESASKDEEIKKYASLNVSTETLPKLFEELASLKTMVSDSSEIMKSASTKDDVAALEARLESIEKHAESRQLDEAKREKMAKSAIAGLDLSPR